MSSSELFPAPNCISKSSSFNRESIVIFNRESTSSFLTRRAHHSAHLSSTHETARSLKDAAHAPWRLAPRVEWECGGLGARHLDVVPDGGKAHRNSTDAIESVIDRREATVALRRQRPAFDRRYRAPLPANTGDHPYAQQTHNSHLLQSICIYN